MKQALTLVIAQCNFRLGQITHNTDQVIRLARQAYAEHQADIIVFPELTLTGYPPEDLLLRMHLQLEVHDALQRIAKETPPLCLVVGHPHYIGGRLFNAASAIFQGKIQVCYFKQKLPNYSVFDEKRYFCAGQQAGIFTLKGWKIALSICEDLWFPEPMQQAKTAGAELVVCLNASPYDHLKQQIRHDRIAKQASQHQISIVYVQCVGGQDELVFDGGSMVFNAAGEKVFQGEYFKTALYPVTFPLQPISMTLNSEQSLDGMTSHTKEQHIYDALCLGLKDYVRKNQFESVILGLSGGIDSALTLAIAVDALGPQHVHAVMLPSPFTSQLSLDTAADMANTLGIHYRIIPINDCFQSVQHSLLQADIEAINDITLQNLQARLRAVLLMALSNQYGHLLLSTSNKSETAVGYTTLYGDMAGGFCVLRDVFKTWVYRLANYRNQQSPIIPQSIIDRPATAELAPNQTDQDSLPEYDELDQILIRYIEHDESISDIVAAGFDATTVHAIIQAVDKAEYKRRQAPPGVKVTTRAFGRDRRYPITK